MNLADKRKLANKSQGEVAQEVGISRAGYANIEIGKRRPSVPVAKKIAAVLGFNWISFFNDQNQETPSQDSV